MNVIESEQVATQQTVGGGATVTEVQVQVDAVEVEADGEKEQVKVKAKRVRLAVERAAEPLADPTLLALGHLTAAFDESERDGASRPDAERERDEAVDRLRRKRQRERELEEDRRVIDDVDRATRTEKKGKRGNDKEPREKRPPSAAALARAEKEQRSARFAELQAAPVAERDRQRQRGHKRAVDPAGRLRGILGKVKEREKARVSTRTVRERERERAAAVAAGGAASSDDERESDAEQAADAAAAGGKDVGGDDINSNNNNNNNNNSSSQASNEQPSSRKRSRGPKENDEESQSRKRAAEVRRTTVPAEGRPLREPTELIPMPQAVVDQIVAAHSKLRRFSTVCVVVSATFCYVVTGSEFCIGRARMPEEYEDVSIGLSDYYDGNVVSTVSRQHMVCRIRGSIRKKRLEIHQRGRNSTVVHMSTERKDPELVRKDEVAHVAFVQGTVQLSPSSASGIDIWVLLRARAMAVAIGAGAISGDM